MERKTATPVIDGGIVNAPPNTTATYDFAENPSDSRSGAGTTSSGMGNVGAPTTEREHIGRGNVVRSSGVGLGNQGQHGYHTGDATGRSEVINTTTATDTRPTSSKIKESASGVKGLAAAVHGAGETIRGNVNATVDRAFNDKAGEAHNSTLATAGEHEIVTGKFSSETKNREGMVPGADGDRRKTRDLLSKHPE